MMENQFEFIAIEGVIGVGKTSLAQRLVQQHQTRLVLEQFEDNPFLPKFYEDRDRYAFPTQMAFLASRFNQQQDLLSKDLFQQTTISDYMFEKDRIFARLNLNEDELALYDKIFNIMAGIAAVPDLVIYLHASTDRLMENIRNRGRKYERNLSPAYLQELNQAYNHFFYHYNKSPLITINTTEVDFVNNDSHFAYIDQQIFRASVYGNTHINIKPD
jgi:deoxyadenosine/deoxycytidine kinase